MFDPSYVLLYVENVPASAAFYSSLLEHAPVENHPSFALFVLSSGFKLGLWAKQEVAPTAPAQVGGSELSFTVSDPKAVEAMHAAWAARGLPIEQAPTQLDFGYSFVARDPDGHRLRVFAPGEQ